MKKLLVLGAGTAGTMIVNKLRPRLDEDWSITIVDEEPEHHYQPGYLFLPFGTYQPSQIVKPKKKFIPKGVDLVMGSISRLDAEENLVELSDGRTLDYDYLVIATGTTPRPEETEGMKGSEWQKSVFDFYTMEGSSALADKLRDWDGGRLVVHISEMPIKCPVAPLEFAFLADSHFRDREMRDQVEITYVTPLDAAFTKPIAASRLGSMLEDRGIKLEPDFYIESVDNDSREIVSYDERRIPFDLLVTVPVNMGADFLEGTGLANDLNFVSVDHETCLSKKQANVFAVGDAADLPTSKAGSVAHFAIEIFTENFLQHVAGEEMTHRFDGHANCFVESGGGKGMLIDFNYETQPLPGKYPIPGLGPFKLLEETELNHLGKLMFKWVYWNALLPGRDLPLPALMSMAGKEEVEA